MDDIIRRSDAIDAFKKELTVGESKGNYVTICSAVGYEGARQILESLPSARQKGKWIWDDEGYHCSECFYHAYGNTSEVYCGDWNFCPHCGAWMEGEEDGQLNIKTGCD